MSDFLKTIIKESGNEYAGVAAEGIDGSDVKGFIDTGSYVFNSLVSGSMYGGIPNNKIIALASESATGKTYFALGMCQRFLEDNPDGVVLYFDSISNLRGSSYIYILSNTAFFSNFGTCGDMSPMPYFRPISNL